MRVRVYPANSMVFLRGIQTTGNKFKKIVNSVAMTEEVFFQFIYFRKKILFFSNRSKRVRAHAADMSYKPPQRARGAGDPVSRVEVGRLSRRRRLVRTQRRG